MERIRILLGSMATREGRVLWEGKAIVPNAFCMGKLRQGGLPDITVTEGARAMPVGHLRKAVAQILPSLGPLCGCQARASC